MVRRQGGQRWLTTGTGGALVYVNEKIIDIEGDPDSPISEGCLCSKGQATFQLVTGSHRVQHVLYRKPYAKEWETIPLDRAMDMIAERVKRAREETWQDEDEEGRKVRRTLGMAH